MYGHFLHALGQNQGQYPVPQYPAAIYGAGGMQDPSAAAQFMQQFQQQAALLGPAGALYGLSTQHPQMQGPAPSALGPHHAYMQQGGMHAAAGGLTVVMPPPLSPQPHPHPHPQHQQQQQQQHQQQRQQHQQPFPHHSSQQYPNEFQPFPSQRSHPTQSNRRNQQPGPAAAAVQPRGRPAPGPAPGPGPAPATAPAPADAPAAAAPASFDPPASAPATAPKPKPTTAPKPAAAPAAATAAGPTAIGGPAGAAGSTSQPPVRALIDWRTTFAALPVPYSVLPEGHPGAGTPGLSELRLGPFEVLLAETAEAAEVAVSVLRERMWDGVVAMDLEWQPDTARGDSHPVALLQLSSAGVIVLLRTLTTGLPAAFRAAIVEDTDIELVVAGWSSADERKFEESFDISTFWCTITELQKVAKAAGHSRTALKALTLAVLEPAAAVPKSKKLSLFNWAAPGALPPEQIKYAALDAACTEHIFRCLEGRF